MLPGLFVDYRRDMFRWFLLAEGFFRNGRIFAEGSSMAKTGNCDECSKQVRPNEARVVSHLHTFLMESASYANERAPATQEIRCEVRGMREEHPRR